MLPCSRQAIPGTGAHLAARREGIPLPGNPIVPWNRVLGPHRAWRVGALRDARAVEVDLPATDPAPPEGRRPDHGEMVALEAVFVQLAVSRAQAVGVPAATAQQLLFQPLEKG